MKAAAFVCALLLAGCATQPETVWYKAGASNDEFMRDRGQCIQATFSATFATTFQQAAIFTGCMQGKGWQERPKT
jgi:hypothetical protein